MGRGTPLSCLGPACCLLLLLGDCGALGSRGKQRGPLEERQSAVTEAAPWGRARYEAVKKQLGAVGALSKQYWQYLACKVWQEGCEKEEEEKTSRGPGKLLPLSCLGNSSGVCTTGSVGRDSPLLSMHCAGEGSVPMPTLALSLVHPTAMEPAAARHPSPHLLPCTWAGWQLGS